MPRFFISFTTSAREKLRSFVSMTLVYQPCVSTSAAPVGSTARSGLRPGVIPSGVGAHGKASPKPEISASLLCSLDTARAPLPSLQRNFSGTVNATRWGEGVTSPRRKSMFDRNCPARETGEVPPVKLPTVNLPPLCSTGWEWSASELKF